MDIYIDGGCGIGDFDRESKTPTWHDPKEAEWHVLLVSWKKPHPTEGVWPVEDQARILKHGLRKGSRGQLHSWLWREIRISVEKFNIFWIPQTLGSSFQYFFLPIVFTISVNDITIHLVTQAKTPDAVLFSVLDHNSHPITQSRSCQHYL